MDERLSMTYEVRGPDPDGDWFIIAIVDGEELFLDETFDSEEGAMAMVARLEGSK